MLLKKFSMSGELENWHINYYPGELTFILILGFLHLLIFRMGQTDTQTSKTRNVACIG